MSKIRYKDKLLPTQNYFANLYRETAPFEEALYEITSKFATDFTASQFKLATPKNVDFEEMSTPPAQLAFFNVLVQLSGAKRLLEIGTFIGHCTMQLARMVGEGGHITTIEIGKEFADLARQNFHENGFDGRITLMEGSAREILGQLPKKSFDVVFIDGSKQDYLEYALKSEGLLSDRGIIIVDDIFFHGDALNDEPATEKGAGCRKLLDHYEHDDKFTKVVLPISNGILLLVSKTIGK